MRLGRTFALSLAIAPAIAAQSGYEAARYVVVVSTTLDAIRANPDAFKNVAVRFPIQFCSIGQLSNPFFTRFVPSQYANFYAWSAEQPIWQRDAYDNVFGMLFLSKDNGQLQELYDQKLYSRLWVTGVVRNVFQNTPWIEVDEFERMEQQVNTATLAHLYRADRHMSRREWPLAISELSLAPAREVPNYVRAAIHKNLGVCYLRMGEARAAMRHLDDATKLMTEVDHETKRLVEIAHEQPEAALDRAVDKDAVREADRPMWEAFSGTREALPQR